MTVDPDLPVTEAEYEKMKTEALAYGFGNLGNPSFASTRLAREDRAFLIYEVTKYELIHGKKLTFRARFRARELAWWQGL